MHPPFKAHTSNSPIREHKKNSEKQGKKDSLFLTKNQNVARHFNFSPTKRKSTSFNSFHDFWLLKNFNSHPNYYFYRENLNRGKTLMSIGSRKKDPKKSKALLRESVVPAMGKKFQQVNYFNVKNYWIRIPAGFTPPYPTIFVDQIISWKPSSVAASSLSWPSTL